VRVAALYDVHGNLPALDAVLAEIPEDVPILVGGDVAAGPWPAETLERLRALGDRAHWIRGNADREVWQEVRGMAPAEMIDFVRARLSEEQLDFLRPHPLTETFDVDGLGRVLFCHATPRNDEEILTRISPDERWAAALAGVEADVVVCGHTHVQFERPVGGVRLVNAGSVGMPYETEAGAYWTLLGRDVELRRTPYVAGDVASSGWPLEWPTAGPEEATELFEQMSRERADAS
jgi:predicted phosphodiesterase